ncbi:MAG: B12-binding domain-containing radical SAM protein [Thermoleophilia bacterium]|nr:B12-binding domain-containing radical SAM protein [Thermoleophilia bacterium]
MKVKMILPSRTARAAARRSIKYSLFPPLGLATLAGYLDADDEVVIQDGHVEHIDVDDDPDLVVIEVYVSSARRAYQLADHYRAGGAHVCLGGLHVTALPDEAAAHADSVFVGPGEDTWPAFLADFRAGRPRERYCSTVRTLDGAPRPRQDLLKRHLYLVPNSIVVSRGCPHDCDFCYKPGFFAGGRSFYLRRVDDALEEIAELPGRHLYFLDDDLFGSPPFARALFDGLRGAGRVWQAAGTAQAVLEGDLVERAAAAGLRSLFVGFETLSAANLRAQHKRRDLDDDAQRRSYEAAVRRLHELGVMVNASFVFGMDEDDASVFARTVDWAVSQGIETATFHILTPYPGTALRSRLVAAGRILTSDWDLYDTRHAVFAPARMTPAALERGHARAYRDFYGWRAIARSSAAHAGVRERLRHLAYAGGWKKLEPFWDAVIQTERVPALLPLLETVLDAGARRRPATSAARGPATSATHADARLPTERLSAAGAHHPAAG